MIIRIIFHDYCVADSIQDILNENVVVCQLIVTVFRNEGLPLSDKFLHSFQRFTYHHIRRSRPSESFPIFARPRIAAHVIAAFFPESRLIFRQEANAFDPFR